jgi:Zn-dependent protease
MPPSFSLFHIAGIRIRIHPSFILLPVFFGVYYGWNYGFEIGVRAACLVLMVFSCVIGHELCHSLKARHYGIDVPVITLYPMGGVASMMRIPREPWQEFWIALVGPLFNFALMLILFFPLYGILGKEALLSPGLESWPRTIANALWINPVLGAFNLIPAFPMDGGRILRALLATRLDYLKATRISVSIGRIFAILFFLSGIYFKAWMLLLIALFVYFAGPKEERHVLAEDFLKRLEERQGRPDEPVH